MHSSECWKVGAVVRRAFVCTGVGFDVEKVVTAPPERLGCSETGHQRKRVPSRLRSVPSFVKDVANEKWEAPEFKSAHGPQVAGSMQAFEIDVGDMRTNPGTPCSH